MSYKIGEVSSARIASGSITEAKLASNSVSNDKMKDQAVGSAELIDASIVGGDLAADIAISTTGDISAAAGTFSGNMTILGDLSVTGNGKSISLEEVQVDQAKIILNREDATDLSQIGGNVGVIVKGGNESDVGLIFKSDGGGTVRFAIDPANQNSAAALECGSISASGEVYADLTGNVTGNVSGSSGSCTGNAATATALATSRQIAGNAFDGSADITIASTDLSDAASFNAPTATLAASATALATARQIAGQAFDGTGNISIASTDLSDAASISAASATTANKWATARTITLGGDLEGSVSLDGSANVTLNATVASDTVALGADTTGDFVASVSCADAALTVAGSGEGAAVSLTVHEALEDAVDELEREPNDFSFDAEYALGWKATLSEGAITAYECNRTQLGTFGKTVLAMDTDAQLVAALGFGSGYTGRDHGDLRETAGQQYRLMESYANYTCTDASAPVMEYKALAVIDASGTTGSQAVNLPQINPNDPGSAGDGSQMRVKLDSLGAGGSVVLTAQGSSLIDGAATFTLSEAQAAVTFMAYANGAGAYHWAIV